MAKKRIRHLEFYGYPDQNTFTSVGAASFNVDDIREKNREQDIELGEKVDKSDFNVLSGTVENFISAQTAFNEAIAEAVDANTSGLTALKEWADDVADDIDKITEIADKADEILSTVSGLSEAVDELSGAVQSKLDTSLAAETFAKKEDVYTKDEIDEILDDISGCCDTCVTEDWLEENGYLTEAEADEKYATIEELDGLSGTVLNVTNDITNIYNTISSITEGSTESIDDLSRKITVISGTVANHNTRITVNEEDIRRLKADVESKASVTSVENLDTKVENLRSQMDNKVDVSTFNTNKDVVNRSLNDLNERKADKSELSGITNSVAEVSGIVDTEREERIAADNELWESISGINTSIENIAEANVGRDDRLTALEDGLAQEIIDRTKGDIDLIGTSEDSATDDTIWGAKKYAVSQRNIAINEANGFTTQEIANLRTEIEGDFEEVEQELSGKADKSYVDEIKNEVKEEVRSEIDNKVGVERQRAEAAEDELRELIAQNREDINENDASVANLADRLNAITVWDGTDPNEYEDTGNGVLDVLHREFHTFKELFDGIGVGTITTNKDEVALGTYNVSNTGYDDKDKTAFSFGIGTDGNHRKNGIEIRKNGDVYMWVEGDYMCINPLLGQLAHETYYDG